MPIDRLWAFGIPALQLAACLGRNPAVSFLRTYLMVEAVNEILLALISIFASLSTWTYAWLAGTFLHHAMCGYLIANIYRVVRLRALPSRQSVIPVLCMTVLSIAAAVCFAHAALGLVFVPTLRMFLPLDHAISFAIGCMVVLVPPYRIAISSSLPRPVALALWGFVIYETAYAGVMGAFVVKQHLDFPHLIDVVYVFSLYVWSTALRSKSPAEATELQPNLLTN